MPVHLGAAMLTSDRVPYRYRSGGIEVRSDRILPGLPAAAGTPADHVLTLVTGSPTSVAAEMPSGQVVVDALARGLYCAVRDADGYLLRIPKLCEVRLSEDLKHGVCRIDPAADPGLAAVLLSGTTLAFVLALAGRCVLHASAVEVDGRGLAFVGHSGMGKSTLTVATCLARARLISEDVLVVETNGEPACLPGNTDVRLRKGANSLLEQVDGWPRTTTGDQRQAVQPPLTHAERVPLDTIIIPRPARRAERLTVETMPPARAVVRLIAFPRVVGLIDPDVARRQLQAMAQIVRAVPVKVATVPWGPPFPADLGEQLLALMQDRRAAR